MGLPGSVASAASLPTGAVNFRTVWRNTARQWCQENQRELKRTIRDAGGLTEDDEGRVTLAARIEALPSIPSPNDKASVRPAIAMSPLIAYLDPNARFPIVNGRDDVVRILVKLGLKNHGLGDQIRELAGLIGQWGINDAFMIDILGAEIAEMALNAAPSKAEMAATGKEVQLPDYDVEESKAARKWASLVYRKRHNKMTEALKQLFKGFALRTCYEQDLRYDVLVKDYDGKSRDLLIEAKPDPDKGAIRIAIGQLLDYRRFLPRRAATDCAILTISSPTDSHILLLDESKFSAIWFPDETCRTLAGKGRAWLAIEKLTTRLASPKRKGNSAV